MQTKCPICDAPMSIASDTEVGELLLCPDCGGELEVESLGENPVLKEAPEEEEDWGE